uniref:Aurora kinase A and ninein interacting protein n=1 Tax=Hippocampus comes TaxID=109280 RepID=A0A3Q2Z983_HIPCM
MKTCKGVQSNPAPEECGVWLDTVELKGKAKQVIDDEEQDVRPISKMLNPLAKAAGYSSAVVFNFTQTKTEMPRTKQSFISSYFSPRSKSDVASEGNLGPETDGEMCEDGDAQEHDEEHNINCEIQEEQPNEMEKNIYRKRQKDEMEQNIEEQQDEMNHSQESSLPLNRNLINFDVSEEAFRMEGFSPPKKRARQHDDEDSLVRLFTQDSDGFRVIAHRGRRSPLKNRNNNIVVAAATRKPMTTPFDVKDVLFTQDSQGNMVIKH